MSKTNLLAEISPLLYGVEGDPYRKPQLYLDEYHRLFEPLRLLPIRLLELGVHQGWSMRMWKNIFLWPRLSVSMAK